MAATARRRSWLRVMGSALPSGCRPGSGRRRPPE
jgi:hypothetical protein